MAFGTVSDDGKLHFVRFLERSIRQKSYSHSEKRNVITSTKDVFVAFFSRLPGMQLKDAMRAYFCWRHTSF